MALTPGTRLGPYEITAQIGVGGMGQVFRARDTRLDRNVAIKILPEAFAHDADRLARLTREAKTLAALNHPHIAGIYGLEESNGVTALVMELVEGDDLSQRIAQGAIPADEALPIAKQIAEALEAAHERGIIHRDLKPANIKLRADGTVKVLDFGLAKAMEPPAGSTSSLSMSPTITTPAMTQAGMILGTAAYMSPEQARGTTVDKRADLWAFGVVLWEMLTGKRLFEGATVSDTLAAVLKTEPEWSALAPATSSAIRRLLRRCLEKDCKRRLDSAAAARLEIEEAMTGPAGADNASAQFVAVPRRRGFATTSIALLVGAAVAALATLIVTRPVPAEAPDPIRFTITPPEGQVLGVNSPDHDVAIAPDGRHLVYQEGINSPTARLVVRAIDQLEAVPLRGVVGSRWPFISADSHWLGFFDQGGGQLRKVPMTGGQPSTVCRVQGNLDGASWGPDDTIVFATDDMKTGLMSVPAGGGEPKVLTTPDSAQKERDHWFPSVLPDGHAVLFTIAPLAGETARVAVLDRKTGRTKTLIRGGSQAEYVETGHLIYVSAAEAQGTLSQGTLSSGAGTLNAVRFDPVRLEILGDPVPVVEQVLTKFNGSADTADFSVSRHGTLVYVPSGDAGTLRSLVWVDRSGREEPINAPPRAYVYARLSPDETRVALDARDQQNDIWIWSFARQLLQRLTTDPGPNRMPVWTPKGERVAFSAERDGVESVFWQASDGSGPMDRLSSGTQYETPRSFSPNGTQLIFSTPDRRPYDIGLITLGSPRTSSLLLHSPLHGDNGEISPDGHWLAYESDESGRNEISVRPFPNVETALRPVSTGGGTRPVWSRNGRELFYWVEPDTIMAVPVIRAAGSAITFGTPKQVVKGPYAAAGFRGRQYDVSKDGRLLLIKDATPGGQTSRGEIHLVVNWQEELKRLVPTR